MAEVALSKVSLSVSGDDLDPAEIGQLLGAVAGISYRKGEPFKLPSGRLAPHGRTGQWSISVPDRTPADIDSQTAELLALLTDDLTIWKALSARFHIRLFCGVMLDRSNEAFGLSPATM